MIGTLTMITNKLFAFRAIVNLNVITTAYLATKFKFYQFLKHFLVLFFLANRENPQLGQRDLSRFVPGIFK